jgi:hypothetical protein
VDRREVPVAQRTATINRLLWRVHELDPQRAPKPRSLDLAKHRRILGDWLHTVDGLVAELAGEELADITRLTEAINVLAKRIGSRVRDVAPALLALPGCGELTAAKLVGEAAGVSRFKSEAAFARHAGVAPVPVWSGNTAGRVRMTRSGNRQLNAALHRIAVTQIRLDGLGHVYYRHRIADGDSATEALRCLKRRLSRIVFSHLHTDEKNRPSPANPQRLDIGETHEPSAAQTPMPEGRKVGASLSDACRLSGGTVKRRVAESSQPAAGSTHRIPPTKTRPTVRTTVASTGGKYGSSKGVRAHSGSIATAVAASTP